MGKLLDQFMDSLSEYNKVGPRAMDYIGNITKKK